MGLRPSSNDGLLGEQRIVSQRRSTEPVTAAAGLVSGKAGNRRLISGLSRLHTLHVGLLRGLRAVLVLAFAVLCMDVLWGVFSRYVIGEQSRFTEELAIYLLVWVSLLGAGVTYGDKGHLGVDYFVGKMDPTAQRIAAIAVELLVAFFSAFALLYGGWLLVEKTLEAGQLSPALGLPMGYVYLAVPLSGLLFLAFAVENLAELFTGQISRRKAPLARDV
jgi:TRAP-type C4-dicarboxylate transport system permease small subunit